MRINQEHSFIQHIQLTPPKVCKWLCYSHCVLPSTTIFIHPSGPVADVQLNFIPGLILSHWPNSSLWKSGFLWSPSVNESCLHGSAFQLSILFNDYFSKRLLSTKVNQSISINSKKGVGTSHKHSTHTEQSSLGLHPGSLLSVEERPYIHRV